MHVCVRMKSGRGTVNKLLILISLLSDTKSMAESHSYSGWSTEVSCMGLQMCAYVLELRRDGVP